MRSRARNAARLGLAVVTAALAAGAVYVAKGHRYRVLTDPHASKCWNAVRFLTLSSSSLRPLRVEAESRDPGHSVRVSIDYHQDRVLAGAALNVTCAYDASGTALLSIEFNGAALDSATLAEVNRELDD